MSTWLIPREELTPEQLRAIELAPKENRVILGGPGSGKTQILLHRGQYLREEMGTRSDRFRIFVYTKALRAYIQSAMSLLDLPNDAVTTLDSWCVAYYRDRFHGQLPKGDDDQTPDYGAIRRAVAGELRTRNKKPFDFVLVDEAQDLNKDAFDLLNAMAGHITVCADHKQQIYEDGSDVGSILAWLGLRQGNVTLLETYRCCPYVVQLASQLISDKKERAAYVCQARTSQGERETPLLLRAESYEHETRSLIDVVRTRLAKGERIAVLFPQQKQAFGYAKGLCEAGVEVENPKQLDFTTDKPKLMPYHSAKGLTFDTVILPRLIPSAFRNLDAERLSRLIFVGITRAIKWVYLSTVDGADFEPLSKLTGPDSGKFLTVRQGEVSPATPSTPPPQASADGIDDLL